MALTLAPLSLDAAVLSGGACIAAAGGGLPRRLTTAADLLATGISGNYNGVVFDPDNLHFWTTIFSGSNEPVKKIRISDGAVVQSVSIESLLMNIMVTADGKLLVAGYGSKRVHEIDLTTFAVTSSAAMATYPYLVWRCAGIADKVWMIQVYTGGAAVEYTWPGVVATGRTIAGLWTGVWPMADGSFWLCGVNGGTPARYRESDLAILASIACPPLQIGVWGENWQPLSVAEDTQGRVYLHHASARVFDRYTAAGVVDRRAIWLDATLGQMCGVYWNSGSHQFAPGIAFSADGNWMAHKTSVSAGQFGSIRVRRLGVQRARWTVDVAGGGTLKTIGVPGCLRRDQGAKDLRLIRCYYSLDGGGSRTEVTPGDLLSATIPPASTLSVDVETTDDPLVPPGYAPWWTDPVVGIDDGVPSYRHRQAFGGGLG